jgi:hypothetical protein
MTASHRPSSWSTLFSGIFGPSHAPVTGQRARFSSRLSSNLEKAYFQAVFQVVWSAGGDQRYASDFLEAHIHQYLSHVAEQVTRRSSVLHAETARSQIAIELSNVRGLSDINVSLDEVNVQLYPEQAATETVS